MGRYDLRPARVRQTVTMLLSSSRLTTPPPWFQIMHDFPPSEILVRTQPVQHNTHPHHNTKKIKKASRLFQPQRIAYEEDELRQEFFSDHPWELARPRVLVESDGKDYEKWDWSLPYQPGRPVNGESVIQRQKHLMENSRPAPPPKIKPGRPLPPMPETPQYLPPATKALAYDLARHEFYQARHFDEVEIRVAREEALSTGAWFGPSKTDTGMGLENKTFEQWKAWAKVQVTLMEQGRNAAYTGGAVGQTEGQQEGEEEEGDALSKAAELLGGSTR